jgi:hypothetical protein
MSRTKKAKAEPRPKDPPEDEPGPQLLTQKRAANQVEALYLDLARIVGRLDGLTHYVDSSVVRECCNALTAELRALMGIRARLLTGEIPITRGEDVATWARRQPLLAAIESANGNGHTNGNGNGRGKTPDDSDPWSAPVSRLSLKAGTVDALVAKGLTTVGQLNRFDDMDPLTALVTTSQAAEIEAALRRYRRLHPPAPAAELPPPPAEVVPPPPPKPERITAADVDQFFAGGELSFRYQSTPVWSVRDEGDEGPFLGVVAVTLDQALAFVAAEYPGRAVEVGPMSRFDRSVCPEFRDARHVPAPPAAESADGTPAKAPRKAPKRPAGASAGSSSKERSRKPANAQNAN